MDKIGVSAPITDPSDPLQTQAAPKQTPSPPQLVDLLLVGLLPFLLNLLNLCEFFSDFSKFCVTLWGMG